jgi:hypothetical protein
LFGKGEMSQGFVTTLVSWISPFGATADGDFPLIANNQPMIRCPPSLDQAAQPNRLAGGRHRDRQSAAAH